eukprot:3521785-Prymnesium_polylepis.1
MRPSVLFALLAKVALVLLAPSETRHDQKNAHRDTPPRDTTADRPRLHCGDRVRPIAVVTLVQ